MARREASKPDIAYLDDAIDWEADTPSGVGFLAKKGDYIIIERRALVLADNPWLDTRVYRLLADPFPNGELKLWDPVREYLASSNWAVGVVNGFQFRFPPRGVNPERFLETRQSVRNGRRRVIEREPVDPNAPKKRRGRPKGSKNRSKETIQAEREALRREREGRRAAREARKVR